MAEFGKGLATVGIWFSPAATIWAIGTTGEMDTLTIPLTLSVVYLVAMVLGTMIVWGYGVHAKFKEDQPAGADSARGANGDD